MKEVSAVAPAGASLPPLHCVVAFEAVARLQSMSRAARELGLTRSALSHSISLLEHRLQVRLFSRFSPTARLTQAGGTYYKVVQKFARTVGDGLYSLSGTSHTKLRVSASPGISRLWLSPKLPEFHSQHPRIDVILTVTEELADVPGNQTDVALRYGGVVEYGTHSVLLWQEVIAPVASPAVAHEASGLSIASLAAQYRLLEHPTWAWQHWIEAQSLSLSTLPHAPVMVCHDATLMLEAAAAGQGIALAPLRLSSRYIARGLLRQAHPNSLQGKGYRAIALCSNVDRPATAAFLAWIDDAASVIPDRDRPLRS